jgi:RNA polymerase sigma-70 factor (ECF subfamily)
MGMATTAILTAASTNVTPPPEFHELYDRFSETVLKTALRVTGNMQDAEDILQTVFLKVWDQKLKLDPVLSPERYLRRSATNAAIDLLRHKNYLAESEMLDGFDYGGKDSTPLLKERLRRALAKIPQEDAELFALCYLEGYTYDELAAQLNLERGTVASRLHRIKASLQKLLSR